MDGTDLKAKSETGISFAGLRKLNLIAGFAHTTQMFLILFLATDFTLPVTASYVLGPPGTPAEDPVVIFDSPIAWGVALFFALSALFHFVVASRWFFPRYVGGLQSGHNYFRWVEYSLSSSIMIVLIAQVTGISNFAALMALFGVNASMILFGWLQEKYEQPGGGMLPFIFGCMAGVVPWLVIFVWLLAPGSTVRPEIPAFVVGIFVSLFIFFNAFALVQWLQYKQVGKWRDYLRGERSYVILSLVAKTALAWQIFSGTLVPPA
ncbi:MAG: heliorhodopsin HeR [Actinomycetota bacterium]